MTFGLKHVKFSSGRSAPLPPPARTAVLSLRDIVGRIRGPRTFMTSYITITNTVVYDVLLTFSSMKAWATHENNR